MYAIYHTHTHTHTYTHTHTHTEHTHTHSDKQHTAGRRGFTKRKRLNQFGQRLVTSFSWSKKKKVLQNCQKEQGVQNLRKEKSSLSLFTKKKKTSYLWRKALSFVNQNRPQLFPVKSTDYLWLRLTSTVQAPTPYVLWEKGPFLSSSSKFKQ